MTEAEMAKLVRTLARQLDAEVIETHISWVLLAGSKAYKLKKPVKLPFLDYSALASRRHGCEEEVRLNGRLAAGLYEGLTRITGSPTAPEIEGAGPLLELAVRMRKFPSGALFSEQIQAGVLRAGQIDALAALLADFHLQAPQRRSPASHEYTVARRANALAVSDGLAGVAGAAEHAALRAWLVSEAARLEPLWHQREAEGKVRECHGDLHLANIVSLDGNVAAFDCIEFSDALRWIDVLDDVAFPFMDLIAHGRPDFAFRFINAWLDRSGDHAGLPALRFAVVYRALVRAQAGSLRGARGDAVARRYLTLALDCMHPGGPALCITHGLPGSGKTFCSQRVLEAEGAIRLRSDVERKRLSGLQQHEDSKAKGLNIYRARDTVRTYAHLLVLAEIALRAGYPVILDAAYLQEGERSRARELAVALQVPFQILHCTAPVPVLQSRLRGRVNDASEADESVLAQLQDRIEPLTADECQYLRAMPDVAANGSAMR